jgi:hypothetical protein
MTASGLSKRKSNLTLIFPDPNFPDAELDQVRHSVNRGSPYGSAGWVSRMAAQLGLRASLRPRGRPRKEMKCRMSRMSPFLSPVRNQNPEPIGVELF